MSWDSKVLWTEGLFLQPHHFQQAARYTEALVVFELALRYRVPHRLLDYTLGSYSYFFQKLSHLDIEFLFVHVRTPVSISLGYLDLAAGFQDFCLIYTIVMGPALVTQVDGEFESGLLSLVSRY